MAVAGGTIKRSGEEASSRKEVTNPHDLLVTDVLSFLVDKSLLAPDPSAAGHGKLIIASGTLILVDRSMLSFAAAGFRVALAQEKSKPVRQQNPQMLSVTNDAIKFFEDTALPSAFVLQTDSGTLVAGTLKEDGMSEPIGSYYFKHGAAGLAGVYVVGVKETPAPPLMLSSGQIMGAAPQSAQLMRNLLFPENAVMVTPIAMFRRID